MVSLLPLDIGVYASKNPHMPLSEGKWWGITHQNWRGLKHHYWCLFLVRADRHTWKNDMRPASAKLRRKVLERYGYTCAFCGVSGESAELEIAHIAAMSHGGTSSGDNLIVLCPNCHAAFDRQPREIEFTAYISELLRKNQEFTDIREEPILGRETRYRADILATRIRGTRKRKILIECKSSGLTSIKRTNDVVAKMASYKTACGDCDLVLAIPSTLHKSEMDVLHAGGIEVWDLEYLATNFVHQAKELAPSYYSAIILSHAGRGSDATKEHELMDSLKGCVPGRRDWYVYQSLVGDVLECLFTPPLSKPLREHSDKSMSNRRDFIVPNHAESGFWAFVRNKYIADYIVVDAKNGARKVNKKEVLQVANYLKPHGAGLFGIIVSRNGADSAGCSHTLREQWLLHQKLILVLDDYDVEAMLLAKKDGQDPADVIATKIQSFRLSM